MTTTSVFKDQLHAVAKPMRILVADDHFANQLLSQSLLQREGHEITLAANGKQALQACESKLFDLILLDIQMPIMNGLEAFKWIKTLDNDNANTPIFALTAHSNPSEIRTIMGKGFGAVLQKPFRISDMMRHLDRPYKTTANRVQTYDDQDNTDPQIYLDVMEMPLLEVQTLDILLEAIGPKRMCRVLTAYWSDAQTMISSLKSTRLTSQAQVDQELIELRKTAHGLKGASANIGLLKASRLSAKLQNAPVADIPFLIEALERTLDDSKTSIRDYCGLSGNPAQPEIAKAS